MATIKRMSVLDICAMAKEMNCAVGLKLVNLYSMSGKAYLLKLAGKVRFSILSRLVEYACNPTPLSSVTLA